MIREINELGIWTFKNAVIRDCYKETKEEFDKALEQYYSPVFTISSKDEIDRIDQTPPPIITMIGPTGNGKTTFFECLINDPEYKERCRFFYPFQYEINKKTIKEFISIAEDNLIKSLKKEFAKIIISQHPEVRHLADDNIRKLVIIVDNLDERQFKNKKFQLSLIELSDKGYIILLGVSTNR